jgi:hypothetical protein
MVCNQGPTSVANRLRLTDGGLDQTRSAFYFMPLDVRVFSTTFRLVISPADKNAEGMTFCIQGLGPTAVGKGASGLGCEGLDRSVAIALRPASNTTAVRQRRRRRSTWARATSSCGADVRTM